MDSDMKSLCLSRNLACRYACMQKAEDIDTELLMNDKFRCLQGFSCLQINIISIIKGNPDVLAYWQVAKLVEQYYLMATTKGAVRGALERLFPRNFIIRNRASKGRLKGNRYALATDPCEHIKAYNCVEGNMDLSEYSGSDTVLSTLKEEIDRKNLSIFSKTPEQLLEELTEMDILSHWPCLAKTGFGTHQIRQIVLALSKVAISAQNVLQGLHYAEWELDNNQMTDKSGQLVSDPCSYIFSSLVRSGCYRKPVGFIDPEEVAEREAIEKTRRQRQLSEERAKEEMQAKFAEGFEQWLKTKTSTDIQKILTATKIGSLSMPEDVALRNYYREFVVGKGPEADQI